MLDHVSIVEEGKFNIDLEFLLWKLYILVQPGFMVMTTVANGIYNRTYNWCWSGMIYITS